MSNIDLQDPTICTISRVLEGSTVMTAETEGPLKITLHNEKILLGWGIFIRINSSASLVTNHNYIYLLRTVTRSSGY
jgi:hypothetical protein